MSGLEKLRLSAPALDMMRRETAAFGGQAKLAAATGIPKPTLQKLLAGDADPAFSRVAAVARALGLSLDEIAGADAADGPGAPLVSAFARQLRRPNLASDVSNSFREHVASAGFAHRPSGQYEVISIPALNITASAGDGSLAVGEHLRPGPFHFASDWLRNSFGSIAALKLVQVKGDSQEPDLHGGDWVMIDDSRTAIENGLAVVRLDDCLMIKWLQREGHLLRLISRNPQYLPTELDLRRDEARLQVIGRAVFVFKAV